MPGEIAYKPPFPASKNINTPIVEQKEFSMTWAEWAAKNRTQVITARTSSGVIYTVPVGYTLYISSAYISAGHNGLATSYIRIYNSATQLLLTLSMSVSGNSAISCPFPCPMKLNSNTQIELISGATNFSGGIVGWLEPNPSS
jgi:hypothetical protein